MAREYAYKIEFLELCRQTWEGSGNAQVMERLHQATGIALVERLEALVEELASANRRLENISLIVNDRRPAKGGWK